MRQAEHKDSAFDHPRCPYYFIANIPLCDFTVANGATEFWLGSHVQTTVADQQTAGAGGGLFSNKPYRAGEHIPWIADAAKAARRAVRPPVQPGARRGDIVIRDLRTWHAGMPNHSAEHRVMLGLGYQVSEACLGGEATQRSGCADTRSGPPRALFIPTTWRGSIYPWRSKSSSWDVQRVEWRLGLTSMTMTSLRRPRQILTLTSDLNMDLTSKYEHAWIGTYLYFSS